jgi:hypothetical protein
MQGFQLTVSNVIWDYNRIPDDASDVFWHYTSRAGFEGILRSGGLRATYRLDMNDEGEFGYARRIVDQALDRMRQRSDLPKVRLSLADTCKINLNRLLNQSKENSTAYCACLTVSGDQGKQWRDYADAGKGIAIGLNMSHILNAQIQRCQKGLPYFVLAPVIYEEERQAELIRRLFEAGIHDMQRFHAVQSEDPIQLTAVRNHVTKEVFVQIVARIDFIKHPRYASEREMRLQPQPNDGTLKARGIQHYEREGKSIPYLFLDLRNPITGRLPLVQITVGPNASFPEALDFVQHVLDDLGYGSGYFDRPRILPSRLPGF